MLGGMDDEMKPWEPNVEDATELARQSTAAVQRLTQMLEEKGVLSAGESTEIFQIFRPDE